MKQLLFLLTLLLAFPALAQQKISTSETYKDDTKLTFYNGYPFTGVAENRSKSGHLNSDFNYESGYLTKYTSYYTTDNVAIVQETYYYEKSTEKKQFIRYSSDKSRREITNYDSNGKKVLEEEYFNDKLIHRCEYKAGKKDGEEFCSSADCGETITYFKNGKKVK